MPDLATLAPLLILLAVLVTAENAFFALLIVPFLPYEVEAFTVFIPTLTALLNLLLTFLRILGAAFAAATAILPVGIGKGCNFCCNAIEAANSGPSSASANSKSLSSSSR